MRTQLPLLSLLVLLLAGFSARTGTAAVLAVERWTVDGGGAGFTQAGSFLLGGTVGQPEAGRVERLGFVLTGGFWGPGAPAATAVDEEPPPPAEAPPLEARIHAVTPNPALAGTRVAFDLPAAGVVEARVYDVRGALVRTLAAGAWAAGRHALAWDGGRDDGSRAGPGLYLVRVRLAGLERTQKLLKLH